MQDNEGEVYCLTLLYLYFSRSCVFDQIVDGVEDEVDWLFRILGNLCDNSCLVVVLLRVNAPVFSLQKLDDGRDKWHDLSSDKIGRGSKVFGIYGFDDFLDDGFSRSRVSR